MSDTTKKPVYTCGASIEGPKVGYRVVAWRNSCKVRVSGPREKCRFHGAPCPYCGKPMYDAPGYAHKSHCSERPEVKEC